MVGKIKSALLTNLHNFGMGLFYAYLDNYHEAEKFYLLAIEEGNEHVLFNLGLLYSNKGRIV